jgi:integrase
MVRVHIKPAPGRVKLKSLSAAHVRGHNREKLDAGHAPRTVRYVYAALNKALKDALADGLVPHNAASVVRPPVAMAAAEQVPVQVEARRREWPSVLVPQLPLRKVDVVLGAEI